jgi:hypothetical protein
MVTQYYNKHFIENMHNTRTKGKTLIVRGYFVSGVSKFYEKLGSIGTHFSYIIAQFYYV